jgi:hypothetical protein
MRFFENRLNSSERIRDARSDRQAALIIQRSRVICQNHRVLRKQTIQQRITATCTRGNFTSSNSALGRSSKLSAVISFEA